MPTFEEFGLLPLSDVPIIEVSQASKLGLGTPTIEMARELEAKCMETIRGIQEILAEEGAIDVDFVNGTTERFQGTHLELLRGFPRAYTTGQDQYAMFIVEAILVVADG